MGELGEETALLGGSFLDSRVPASVRKRFFSSPRNLQAYSFKPGGFSVQMARSLLLNVLREKRLACERQKGLASALLPHCLQFEAGSPWCTELARVKRCIDGGCSGMASKDFPWRYGRSVVSFRCAPSWGVFLCGSR